jgi:hypothetical protein
MFIEDTDLVEVKIYYKKNGHNYKALTEGEVKSLKLKDEAKKKYQCLTVKMRTLTWSLYNDLQDRAMVEGASGERHFNFKLYKENRMKELVKEWDAQKDGKPLPMDINMIGKLSPIIAEAILRGYDEISFVDEDEEKN